MITIDVSEKAKDFIDALSEYYFSEDKRIINIGKVIKEFLCFKLDIMSDFEPMNIKQGEIYFTSSILGDCEAVTLIKEKRIITKMSNSPRQRFTLCHEIGHIILDHKEQSNNNEKEANEFASELMFPYFNFKKDIENMPVCFETITELERLYQASKQVTIINYAKKHSKPVAMAELNNNFKVNYCFGSNFFPLRIDKGLKIKLSKTDFEGVLKHQIKNNDGIFNIEAIRYNAGFSYLVLIKSKEL